MSGDEGKPLWDMDLAPLVGRNCAVSTRDGIHREGKISAVGTSSFKFNGEVAELPSHIELNGDSHDRIEFSRIETLNLL
jgi:hypothetical protein